MLKLFKEFDLELSIYNENRDEEYVRLVYIDKLSKRVAYSNVYGSPKTGIDMYIYRLEQKSNVSKMIDSIQDRLCIVFAEQRANSIQELYRLGLEARSEKVRVDAISKFIDITSPIKKIRIDDSVDGARLLLEVKKVFDSFGSNKSEIIEVDNS